MKVWVSSVDVDAQVGSSTGTTGGNLDSLSDGLDHMTLQSSKQTPIATPPWSEVPTWAQDLENINTECLTSLNTVFETCQDDLETGDWNNIPLDIWEQHLDAAFELLRTRANTTIDQSKSKAKTAIRDMPPHVRGEATGWFMRGMCCVVNFFGFVGEQFKRVVETMRRGVRGAWGAILRGLRVGVARRAVLAAEGIRRLESNGRIRETAREDRSAVQLTRVL